MKRFEKAVVIGASFAGLWAARILADHFEEVVILERDQLPETAVSRPGVPQDKHVHVLLVRGASILTRLFPGIDEELLALGAKRFDLTGDTMVKIRGVWLDRFDSGHVSYGCSRILLESVLRKRVMALPNVTVLSGCRVSNLIETDGAITAVQVNQADAPITADFVVDASGRRSNVPKWLAELGYGQVAETLIDVKLGYAGRRYKKPAQNAPDWDVMLIGADPEHQRRAGLIYSEENDIWMVMLAGVLADYPPTDEQEFLRFAQDVAPEFAQALSTAEPISKIIGYRNTANRFHHFERLERWPERFVVVGDAVCAFNPVYGQGMSIGAMAAEALTAEIEKANGQLDGVARAFQKRYPKIVEPAWLLATSADLEWLGGQEATNLAERIAGWYMPKVLKTIPHDRVVQETFTEVQNLLKPPTVFFTPQIVGRVVRFWLRRSKLAQ